MPHFQKFPSFLVALAEGKHNFTTDQVKLAFFAGAPTLSDATINFSGGGGILNSSKATEIPPVGGYVKGGMELGRVSAGMSGGQYQYRCGSIPTLTATAQIGPFQYVVAYNASNGDETARPVICWKDMEQPLTVPAGGAAALTFGTDPLFTLNINQPLTVIAGKYEPIQLPDNSVDLQGTVAGDSSSGTTITQQWSVISGPDTVTFSNQNAPETSVTFSEAGIYVLRLTASDGLQSAYDDTTIIVKPVQNLKVVVHGDMTFTQLSGGIVRTAFNNCYIETDEGSWLDTNYSAQTHIKVRYVVSVRTYQGPGDPYDAGYIGHNHDQKFPSFPLTRSVVNGKARFTFSGTDDTSPFVSDWNVDEWGVGSVGAPGGTAGVVFQPFYTTINGSESTIWGFPENENIKSGGKLPKTWTQTANITAYAVYEPRRRHGVFSEIPCVP